MNCIGVDLGTCLSSVAILENKIPVALNVETGSSNLLGSDRAIPSSIFVEDDGNIILGQRADNSRLKNPSRYRKEFKRDLGTIEPYHIGDFEILPEEIYREFFKYFKKKAEERLSGEIEKAVITHPAIFTGYKKEMIKKAAEMAGVTNVELIDEPTAAAVYYSTKEKIEDGEKLLVYDLGGGTFDVSLIIREGDGFRALTPPLGIERCGGVDFQRKIYEDIVDKFSSELFPILSKKDMMSKQIGSMIESESIKIKHNLSFSEKADAVIMIPSTFGFYNYEIQRKHFENMIKEYIDATCRKIEDIVKNANIKMQDIGKVLLVGGSSRIPYVEEMIRKTTGKTVCKDIDTELVVCYGAAIWGNRKAEKTVKNTSSNKKKESTGDTNIITTAYQPVIEKSPGGLIGGIVGEILSKQNINGSLGYTHIGETRGNTAGNIINGGIASAQGDWIYFLNQEKYRSIYKIKPNGTGICKINNDVSSHINVIGDWIYYRNYSKEEKIYKIKLDGEEETVIDNDKSGCVSVVGDWIYYTNHSDGGKIYKIKTDGTGKKKINSDDSSDINVIGDWIYYANGTDEYTIYKIKTNGTSKKKVSYGEAWNINVSGDWIYYSNRNGEGIYKIKTDGTSKKKITDDEIWAINVLGDWIYYVNVLDDNKVYKLKTDGTQKTLVDENENDIEISDICIVKDWIFYVSDESTFRIKTDGLSKEKISSNGGTNFTEEKNTDDIEDYNETIYDITEECILCGACISECPVSAISEGDDKYEIDLDMCISCGNCMNVCPVDAVIEL